jgi:hypothetical protein
MEYLVAVMPMPGAAFLVPPPQASGGTTVARS